MRVLAFPSDKYGCGQWRVNLPAQTAMRQTPSLRVQTPLRFPGVHDAERLIALDESAYEFDLAIIQRPTHRIQLDMIGALKRHGVAVVVEIDDLLSHVNAKSTPGRTTANQHKRALQAATQAADLVTCSTPELAKAYGSHGRVKVIENYVPRDWTSHRSKRDGSVVGWPGTVANHWADLETTHGGVGDAIRDTDARFRVIGRPELVQEKLQLDKPPETVEWVEFGDYPAELAKLDIGIAPLNQTRFNRAKSWLKILELSAAGVPWVASPVAEYVRFFEQTGIGTLAASREEWRHGITELLRNPDLRAQEGERNRQAVLTDFCLEDHAHEWVEAWQTALDTRARSSSRPVAQVA